MPMLTTDELVAFPDDDIDRWLVCGELRTRSREHRTPAAGLAITGVGCALNSWARERKPRRGVVLVDAYHRLARDSDTTLGIDLSLISSRQWDAARRRPFVEGRPLLAAKVISHSDTHSDLTDTIHEFLNARVRVVWVVDPDFETVTAFSRTEEPRPFSRGQELTAEPHLSGFRVRMAELFESRAFSNST